MYYYTRKCSSDNKLCNHTVSSRDISVRIATKLKVGCPMNFGSMLSSDKRYIFSPKRPDELWASPSLLFKGYQFCFLGIKSPGLQTNLSPIWFQDWSYTLASLINNFRLCTENKTTIKLRRQESACHLLIISNDRR